MSSEINVRNIIYNRCQTNREESDRGEEGIILGMKTGREGWWDKREWEFVKERQSDRGRALKQTDVCVCVCLCTYACVLSVWPWHQCVRQGNWDLASKAQHWGVWVINYTLKLLPFRIRSLTAHSESLSLLLSWFLSLLISLSLSLSQFKSKGTGNIRSYCQSKGNI